MIVALYVLHACSFRCRPRPGSGRRRRQQWGDSFIVRRFLPFVACLIMAVLPWHNAFSRKVWKSSWCRSGPSADPVFSGGAPDDQDGGRSLYRVSSGAALLSYQAAWVSPVCCAVRRLQSIPGEGLPGRYGWRLLLLALTAALSSCRWSFRSPKSDGCSSCAPIRSAFWARGRQSDSRASKAGMRLKVVGVFVFAGPARDGNGLYPGRRCRLSWR